MSDEFENFFDDFKKEAPATETKAEVKSPEQEAPAAPPAEETKQAPAKAEDFQFDLSDLQTPGVVVGDLGVQVSRLPVERARFTKNERSLISIVIDQVVAIKTHFREGLGSYLCLGDKCCDIDGLPRVRYLFPIVVYDTDKKGKPQTPALTYRTLSVGRESYGTLQTIEELNGKLSGMDLLVTCSDEQYQRVDFQFAGEARYRKSSKLVKEVREFWQAHLKDLITPIAVKKTLEQITDNQGSVTVETRGDVNFDEVFDDK